MGFIWRVTHALKVQLNPHHQKIPWYVRACIYLNPYKFFLENMCNTIPLIICCFWRVWRLSLYQCHHLVSYQNRGSTIRYSLQTLAEAHLYICVHVYKVQLWCAVLFTIFEIDQWCWNYPWGISEGPVNRSQERCFDWGKWWKVLNKYILATVFG